MIEIRQLKSIDSLSTLKQEYIELTSAPLDGMWLCGFVPAAKHYGFYDQNTLVGYCCVNDDAYMLQFYLRSLHLGDAGQLLKNILAPSDASDSLIGNIKGAFVSTAESQFLSHCFDVFSRFSVNALMYQLAEPAKTVRDRAPVLDMALATTENLQAIVAFAHKNVGAPPEWLTGYYNNLISRQEVFGHWLEGRLLAIGECRGFDQYQTDYADLGVIVEHTVRGKGLATKVMQQMVIESTARGLRPICSTELENLAAQKAISRAGFVATNRIVQFDV